VVGIPGRIIYRSGVRVDPLEHGSLPDSEAEVIRALVDRIESLEQQLQTLQQHQHSSQPLLSASLEALEGYVSDTSTGLSSSCNLRDRVIQEFLDGAGI
jgi:serine O-acetyltransferase